jgi:hypothetical protein
VKTKLHGEAVVLKSGRAGIWQCPHIAFLHHYMVLTFPQEQGEPTKDEQSEMLSFAVFEARRISEEVLNDPESFVIIQSGSSNRRSRGWHIHMVLVKNRWEKAWLYFVLFGKNILQAIGLRKDSRCVD